MALREAHSRMRKEGRGAGLKDCEFKNILRIDDKRLAKTAEMLVQQNISNIYWGGEAAFL